MIFVTLGTHYHPFPRALDVVEPLAIDHEMVVQHGHTPPRPPRSGWRWVEFLPYEEVANLMHEADVVVSHAGVGSLFTALGVRKTPLVVPRLRRLREHVDDHQLQLAKKLAEANSIVLYRQGDDIRALAEAAYHSEWIPESGTSALKLAVGAATEKTSDASLGGPGWFH